MNKLIGFGVMLSLLFAFGSCKPKQSAYKSVYEAAKERELEENNMEDTSVPITSISKPAYPEYGQVVDETEQVKKEVITPVYESDADELKSYSVVIASLSVKPNADALKSRMEREGYNVILAQNTQGMYRVIIASFNDKVSAISQRNQIRDKYLTRGSSESLRKMYGIPFDDLWILERQY